MEVPVENCGRIANGCRKILIMENKVICLYTAQTSSGIINNYFQFKNTYKRNFMVMERFHDETRSLDERDSIEFS
jgi:hypothetical protein